MPVTNEQTHLSKWGNSHAARIPSRIIKELHLEENQTFDILLHNDEIILKPVKKRPKNIHDLFKGWEDDGIRDRELDWGKAQGKELKW